MGQSSGQKKGAQAAGRGRSAQTSKAQKPNVIEWVIGAVSAAMVVAMVGFILYRGLSEVAPQPNVAVERGEIEAAGEGYRVTFRAVNKGGRTAAAVAVEGQLLRDGQPVETSEVQLDYVPARSHRSGGLFFTLDPTRHQLQLRATGYKQP